MSLSVGVTCGLCGADIGDQFKPGDGIELFKTHVRDAHPELDPEPHDSEETR